MQQPAVIAPRRPVFTLREQLSFWTLRASIVIHLVLLGCCVIVSLVIKLIAILWLFERIARVSLLRLLLPLCLSVEIIRIVSRVKCLWFIVLRLLAVVVLLSDKRLLLKLLRWHKVFGALSKIHGLRRGEFFIVLLMILVVPVVLLSPWLLSVVVIVSVGWICSHWLEPLVVLVARLVVVLAFVVELKIVVFSILGGLSLVWL
jgi:hypothetical protein